MRPSISAFAVLFSLSLILSGCGAKEKPAPAPAIQDLSYAVHQEGPLTYSAVYTQNIDIGGSEVPLRGERAFSTTYVLVSESEGSGPVKASITIEDYAASFYMAHKHSLLETDQLQGKNLVLSVDPKGGQPEQVDGLPRLNLGSTAGGKLDPAFLIEYSFPRLPSGPLQDGDTWEESTTGRRLEGNFQVDASVTTVHRYAGIEEVNHVPCVKIESSSTGRLKGSQDQMGEHWSYSGTLEGTATWFFEPKASCLVRYNGTESTRGTAKSASASAPITQETKIGIVHIPGV